MKPSTGNVHLTPAEIELLGLIHAGLARTNREMAARLFVSPKTIEARLTNLYRKFEVTCLAHLILRTVSHAGQHDGVMNLRVGDYRTINGKRFRVASHGSDSRGWPCVVLEREGEVLTVPLSVSLLFDALESAA